LIALIGELIAGVMNSATIIFKMMTLIIIIKTCFYEKK